MTKLIRIKKNTSVTDIEDKWEASAGTDLIVEISKSSSFELFCEGIALGRLKDYKLLGCAITVRLHQAAPKIDFKGVETLSKIDSVGLVDLTGKDIPEILCGIFGMQLTFQSVEFVDFFSAEGVNGKEARSLIGSTIWNAILKQDGVLGDGKRRYLFSRHDYRVPKTLGPLTHLAFPESTVFRKNIIPIIRTLSSEQMETKDKRELISTWVYHIAENSFEHGSMDLSNDVPLREYSGILVEKRIFKNEAEVSTRHDISPMVKNYISNLYENSQFDGVITIITVMDGGLGVQNSLPSNVKSADSVASLSNAFVNGVTRQPVKDANTGFGLFDSVRVVKKLRAGVVLGSGNVFVFSTFEGAEADAIDFANSSTSLGKTSGTSFSILWPSFVAKDP